MWAWKKNTKNHINILIKCVILLKIGYFFKNAHYAAFHVGLMSYYNVLRDYQLLKIIWCLVNEQLLVYQDNAFKQQNSCEIVQDIGIYNSIEQLRSLLILNFPNELYHYNTMHPNG
ncbi:hypothetical protein BDA99DRAFT_540339 [Phascolomyces articulosus]|uniref:Uncharacterized protein n=1 Tax=Phascolomyces articulosus TaxID=60185 RepID=A0AAD5PB32_9FUNG|nr:hypothetical protein BDA99DRAFT_540339 [Phascolomyces articulosus]